MPIKLLIVLRAGWWLMDRGKLDVVATAATVDSHANIYFFIVFD